MKKICCALILVFVAGIYILKSQDTQKNIAEEATTLTLENDTTPFVEKMATFQGRHWMQFQDWVESHLVYPESAVKKGIQGKVVVQFSISSRGKMVDVKIVRGLHRLLNKEVLRVVNSSPDWEPAIYKGRYVRQQFYMPVVFEF